MAVIRPLFMEGTGYVWN